MLAFPALAHTHAPIPARVLRRSAVITAVEHIRPMRGGSQPHLMRCSDGHYYVVKFANNPQGSRVLVNEFIAGKLAKLLELPCPDASLVEVGEALIHLTPELAIELPHMNIPVESGLTFGSQYPSYRSGNRRMIANLIDFSPGGVTEQVENLSDFLGILMFDRWTCNTDHRQVLFLPQSTTTGRRYRILMIDNGFCFNGAHWNFPNCALIGLYEDRTVYRHILGMKSFETWLGQLELKVTCEELMNIAEGIPAEWLPEGTAALTGLLECLFRRKNLVPELIRQSLARCH